ncbi:GNAT family N-acetyltransferase [Lentzea tibetensis]|uniref:GNAT family N-acetyltransferase n=1 Tax=Lentzea tibetensis TaxID=2591470 RepID=A0A563ER00_9PSEU|nr:GNAT family N-acetyltransferase [Lentzea tibetensis]TWP49962.1 GNAT family N-acetyltransferase [Lentzea tibetensis]
MRRAVAADAEAIAEVHTRTWQVGYRGVLPDEFLDAMDWRQRVEPWRRNLENGTVHVAVAGPVVGFIAMGPARGVPDTYELYAIYVRPESWGTGAADELIAVLPAQTTVLWVLAENPRARRFYERHGFVLDGETRVDTIGGREVAEVRYTHVSP